MAVFTYRMPAGIPGGVSRHEHSTIEAQHIDVTNPPNRYGGPVKVVNGYIQPFGAGDAATALYGFLVRPYPTQSINDPLGTSTPPTSGVCNVLKRGYMMARIEAGAATKNGPVYLRVTAGSGRLTGAIEGAADGVNTVVAPNAVFMGPADGTGNTEIAFNI